MTVLIVDDDEVYLRSVKRRLKGVVQCENSIERGLRKAREWQPAVIVLDVHFKEEQLLGLDYIREFMAASPRAQVIVTSAIYDEKDAVAALELGAFSYAEKGDVAALRGLAEVARTRVGNVFVPVVSSWVQ
jgi:ActR/RegA family two-component response regulator